MNAAFYLELQEQVQTCVGKKFLDASSILELLSNSDNPSWDYNQLSVIWILNSVTPVIECGRLATFIFNIMPTNTARIISWKGLQGLWLTDITVMKYTHAHTEPCTEHTRALWKFMKSSSYHCPINMDQPKEISKKMLIKYITQILFWPKEARTAFIVKRYPCFIESKDKMENVRTEARSEAQRDMTRACKTRKAQQERTNTNTTLWTTFQILLCLPAFASAWCLAEGWM